MIRLEAERDTYKKLYEDSKDEQTKKATQKMLYDLIERHWKATGGV